MGQVQVPAAWQVGQVPATWQVEQVKVPAIPADPLGFSNSRACSAVIRLENRLKYKEE